MNFNKVNTNLRALPEEGRLVRQAKSGDSEAFVQLYDAYGDDLYRYVYFRVINDVAAEGITSHVFRYAWEHLESYQKKGSSFIAWIYKIARNQVIDYYKGNVKPHAFDIGSLSAAADYRFIKDGQDLFNLEAWRSHLRLLTIDTQHTLLQMRTLQTVARYLDYLNPAREIKPSPTFNAYTRSWLTRYLRYHPRRPQRTTPSWRMSLAFTVLIAALLITGTAKAQSALPGEILYSWKRTSEEAWRTFSPDPIGTEIILADRRLSEWIAVENDPARSAAALKDYSNALAVLDSTTTEGTRQRILPMLKIHKRRLDDAGLATTQLDHYLTVAASPVPGFTPNQVASTQAAPLAIEALPEAAPQPTHEAVEGAVPATSIPTAAALPPTEIPTEVVPATEVPTEVVPATEVPTEVAPATEVPTEVAPATEVPTEIAPATEAPTESAPPATEAPAESAPPATEVPTDAVIP